MPLIWNTLVQTITYLPPLVPRQPDGAFKGRNLLPPAAPWLDRQFLDPRVPGYYYQSLFNFYFISLVMSPSQPNQEFILGRTSRLGKPQSWVNSDSYLAPKNIVQRLKHFIDKFLFHTKIVDCLIMRGCHLRWKPVEVPSTWERPPLGKPQMFTCPRMGIRLRRWCYAFSAGLLRQIC